MQEQNYSAELSALEQLTRTMTALTEIFRTAVVTQGGEIGKSVCKAKRVDVCKI